MRFGNGFWAGVATGAIWGFVWMIVVSVVFMLVSGAIARPPVGISTLAGALGGALMAATPLQHRRAGRAGRGQRDAR